MSKRCSRCKLDKDEEDFARLHCAPDGRQYACRVCLSLACTESRKKRLSHHRAVGRKWYHDNRDRVLAHQKQDSVRRAKVDRAWVLRNPERVKARQKKFLMTPKGRDKQGHDKLMNRLWQHKVTLDQYHSKAESQDFLCAICHLPPVPKAGRGGSPDGFRIDHDHATNRFRGLLCSQCNVGIGMLKDSIPNLQSAIQYLT